MNSPLGVYAIHFKVAELLEDLRIKSCIKVFNNSNSIVMVVMTLMLYIRPDLTTSTCLFSGNVIVPPSGSRKLNVLHFHVLLPDG